MHLTTIVFASVAALGYSSPFREQLRISDFCDRHSVLYERYCAGRMSDFDPTSRSTLERFCAEYDETCASRGELTANLVVPPPLPKSSNVNFDLPMPREEAKKPARVVAGKFVHGLTPEIVATCTPDCTQPHCTTACKCAYTHPKVHGMCNPPATADLVPVCEQWYGKCTLFQPLAYY